MTTEEMAAALQDIKSCENCGEYPNSVGHPCSHPVYFAEMIVNGIFDEPGYGCHLWQPTKPNLKWGYGKRDINGKIKTDD